MTTNANGVTLWELRPSGHTSGKMDDDFGLILGTEPDEGDSNCMIGQDHDAHPGIEDDLKPGYRNLKTVFQVGCNSGCNQVIDGTMFDTNKSPVNQDFAAGLRSLPAGIIPTKMTALILQPTECAVELTFTIQDIDGTQVGNSLVVDMAAPLDVDGNLGAAYQKVWTDWRDTPLMLAAKHYLMVEVTASPDNPDDCTCCDYGVELIVTFEDDCSEARAGLPIKPMRVGTVAPV